MKERDLTVLQKILKEILALEDIVRNIETFEEFESTEIHKRASVMTLLNIGELVHHLSLDFKRTHENIPFHAITGLRNVAAHGYLTLNFKLIWSTICESIPELKENLLAIPPLDNALPL